MRGQAKPPLLPGRRPRPSGLASLTSAAVASAARIPVPGSECSEEKETALRVLLTILVLLAGTGAGVGCSESSPPEKETEVRLEPVHWPAVEGAARYRIQAWHEHRLLFEISRTDTVLVLTPSLARAVRPFEGVEIEVRATDAAGEPLGGVHEARWEP